MSKDKNKAEKPTTTKQERKGVPTHGLWGVAFLIVCASILYANYRVFFGVDELIPRLMLLPSTLAVAVFLVIKSLK